MVCRFGLGLDGSDQTDDGLVWWALLKDTLPDRK
jgi:hypothetical protein